MAFTKLSFTKSKAEAKTSLRYYTHRLTEEGSRTTRDIFDPDGKISKLQGYRKIDRAGEYVTFFRMIISPDPNSEDTGKNLNLRELTKDTMIQLQRILGKKRAIDYLGIAHTDHSNNRHVHAICFISGRIGKEALRKIREAATQASWDQQWTLSRDLLQSARRASVQQESRPLFIKSRFSAAFAKAQQLQTREWSAGGGQQIREARGRRSIGRDAPSCPMCGAGQVMEGNGRYFECPNCGMAIKRTYGIGIEIVKRPGLELSLEEVGEL